MLPLLLATTHLGLELLYQLLVAPHLLERLAQLHALAARLRLRLPPARVPHTLWCHVTGEFLGHCGTWQAVQISRYRSTQTQAVMFVTCWVLVQVDLRFATKWPPVQ